ncbi:Protein of unknown function [Pyronema omphalodes CBS 100304]|uniref:Uncharacterized protein n=1 Tax=Pyronema omphalodes (strain CBS 100304) TaxID=1076935 RepID=U4L5A1_PYROM|nr:Protein of unknown function [Pyronema omphalodes CBS 100304]
MTLVYGVWSESCRFWKSIQKLLYSREVALLGPPNSLRLRIDSL